MVAIGNFNLSSSIRKNPQGADHARHATGLDAAPELFAARRGRDHRRSKAGAAAGEGKVCPLGAPLVSALPHGILRYGQKFTVAIEIAVE